MNRLNPSKTSVNNQKSDYYLTKNVIEIRETSVVCKGRFDFIISILFHLSKSLWLDKER